MPPLNDGNTSGRAYWRSLDHLADTPEFRAFMHREFPAGASELLDSTDRRHFLKIMGASMALAGLGLTGCRRWPKEEIVPYAGRPEGRDPGIPVSYATCMELGGVACGLLATANDGRPTKIEGNDRHPVGRGAADSFAQAGVLDLYDPDRSRSVRREGKRADWPTFADWAQGHFGQERERRGHGMAVLAEASSSPSLLAMRRRFLEIYPNASWHEYEPLNNDNEVAGAELAFGSPHRAQIDPARAKVIVSLDADFLGAHRNAVRNIRDFAAGRRADDATKTMNRLYAFESEFTLTGANADHRHPVRSGDIAVIAAWLAGRIVDEQAWRPFEEDPAAGAVLTGELRATLEHALTDLQAHRGECLIVTGAGQPAEVHLLAHLMNEALGNVGRTIAFTPQPEQAKHSESIRALADRLADGKIGTLVILGGNPAYNAPADLDFPALPGKAGVTIHLGDYYDETATRCTWHVNRAHYLETWGDGRAWDGTCSLGQPIIEPLFGGKSALELLAVLVGDDTTDGQAIVRRTFFDLIGGEDEARWRRALHDGVLANSAWRTVTPAADRSGLAAAAEALHEASSARSIRTSGGRGWEVVFRPHPTLYDGRFANNGWLQEVPDPMTKLTWDTAVLLSPAAAGELGIERGDVLKITLGERSLEAAAMIQPGLPERCAVLPLGGGRGFEGRICTGAGFDFYRLRTSEAMSFAGGATITKTGGRYELVTTQDHHTIDVETIAGRSIQQRLPSQFREADLEEYRHHPNFAKHRTHVTHRLSLFEENLPHQAGEGDYAWGMSIDLNACVGCGACIVACQAENNIPIVGKDQVKRGREMHWLRVDRYFQFAPRNDRYDPNRVTAVALQPVPCMHCENAPCEQVCPVAATVHDADGLNVMVYNRCIGTRYCSNNCPYKVRRFNYFDYHRRGPARTQPGKLLQVETDYFRKKPATPDELKQLQFNPEVTVRMRGVMEKCTYCIQRIAQARIDAKNAYANLPQAEKEKRKDRRIAIPDGAITPACAQTCPAQAIVFGDLEDADSRVARARKHERSYEMLEELNVKARTTYMAKLRNPAAPGSGESQGDGARDESPARGDAGHSGGDAPH
ncbi:MAG: TAT-variant-translocated molybdopterin oxidoreductase [Planctomycetota bacterium]|nr:TAT-variant-translocated molybdopterin oxidoreductase [Planctomycetota bacterium]